LHTIVISSGTRPVPRLSPGRVIAADGGLHRALTAGLRPELVVGDLDSVNEKTLHQYLKEGGAVQQFPTDKNATDLELALDLVAKGTDVTVVGGDGDDRFDHFIGELTHLASRAPDFGSLTILYPPARIAVLSSGQSITLSGIASSIVSLVPLFEAAKGVTTEGLRWPLRNESLSLGTTRGMSNELVGTAATVSLENGTLLAIQPLALETP
jgi:thiamine pyrophosphokinase